MEVTGPRLYPPGPALSEFVDYYGYWERATGEPHRSRALPRGAATIVIDVSGRPRVDFFAADGHTSLDVPSAFIAGAGTASYITGIEAAQTVMTVHFKPAGALGFLGFGMGALENFCVGLTEVWGRSAGLLHEQLVEMPSPTGRIALIEAFLLSHRQIHDRAPSAEILSVLRSVECDPSVRISLVRAEVGWSPRRLSERFRAEVGLGPKSYQRVRRLQGALRRLDGAAGRGADIAADLGYFDQPHFVREFRAFTGLTPTQYTDRRSWLPGHVELGQKYPMRAARGTRG
jgi:AraC-like DNA-binding protein